MTMNPDTDKFWKQIAAGLGRHTGLAPMTPEEAQAEFEALPDDPLSDAQIEDIIECVTSGELADWTPPVPDFDTREFECQGIEEDVLQLNRNEGDGDEATDELLDELRRKALEDGQADGDEDKTGMGDDPESPAEGG
ncbi:MAG: hypothetical protein Kow00105_11080 [Phycisphaeraceae bacterium]